MKRLVCLLVIVFISQSGLCHAETERFTYLDENNPYYPNLSFPKLTTPQWVGEDGVEAVVILGIDDMRETKKYEDYLRPILIRLRQIDGRAPVSIMTNRIDQRDDQLQQWLAEGLSIETHTYDHPCPLLHDGDFAKAKSTYDRCVDWMAEIANSKPVAFRTPCCDSLNTVSPRFFAEIFNRTTESQNFLTIDTSVFNVFTSDDTQISKNLVLDANGQERFLKYVPVDRKFVNYVENYPYPYIINRLCWEFPCVAPSDWSAQHHHGVNNPQTITDWSAAIDITVEKQGVFCLVFHPHGWIRSDQVVEMIDHAVKTHGSKVKFLTFREAQERLDKHLLDGHSIRNDVGDDNNIRLLDVDHDGFLDVLRMNDDQPNIKVWQSQNSTWKTIKTENYPEDVQQWLASRKNKTKNSVIQLPDGSKVVNQASSGVRFVDIDEDGHQDLVLSNAERYGIWLYDSKTATWNREILAGTRGEENTDAVLPPITRADGSDNGFFVHSRMLCWQNEDTNKNEGLIETRTFDELLENTQPTAKSPTASLKLLETRPGFRVELVAAEPLVMDPVALDWGPDGKLWVVEMGDYPLNNEADQSSGGRVRYLEDTNQDGQYDKSTLFADNIPYPTGVMAWNDGVLVTAAPDILYLADTNHDGHADKKEVLYTGFGEGNQQHRVNGLRWGLDNWIYCANGDSNGKIRSMKTQKVVDISGRDFRIRPQTGELETQSGRTQFGRNRDDWGNWFGCNNSNPMFHFVLNEQYLSRNPYLSSPGSIVQVSQTPGAAPCFPISRTLERFNDFNRVNRFTSACSAMIYRDDVLGAEFYGNSFVSEPVHNLVHREIVQPRGLTFSSERAPDEQQSEFLRSRDNWFRPTMIRTGPDGGLWIADMYRHVIEHPEWIPQDWQDRLDLHAGHTMGRIYRVLPIGTRTRPVMNFEQLSTQQLVAALDHSNGWQRDLCQRLLVARKDLSVVESLETMVKTNSNPVARLHALCTLDGLQALTPDIVLASLADSHPGVRRHAIRLSEQFVNQSTRIKKELERLVADDDPQIQLQLAYTLGEWQEAASGEVLGKLAIKKLNDQCQLAAVLSSLHQKNLASCLRVVLSHPGKTDDLQLQFLEMAGRLGTIDTQHEAVRLVLGDRVSDFKPSQFQAIAVMLEAMDRKEAAEKLFNEFDHQANRTSLGPLTKAAYQNVFDRDQPIPLRLASLRYWSVVASVLPMDEKLETQLAKLLVPQEPVEIQLAAVQTLSHLANADASFQVLSNHWNGLSPAVRGESLDACLSRPTLTRQLLQALQAGSIETNEIDSTRRQRLLNHSNQELRKVAEQVFATSIDSNREDVLQRYQGVLSMNGQVPAGATVFKQRCSSCHRLQGTGHVVGPDLAALKNTSPEFLLTAILDPNRAIESKFLSYTALTFEGLTYSGLLASESGNSISLVMPEAKQVEILRRELDELICTQKSAMPEGLEKDLSPQDLADVIAFVASAGAGRKQFEGNTPMLVEANEDSSLQLLASQCEIYGPNLVFEQQYQNLGFWGSMNDYAVWHVRVPHSGQYRVQLTYACAPQMAGNQLKLQLGPVAVTGQVKKTNGWDDYRELDLGQVQLSSGEQQVRLIPTAMPKQYLLDLKQIRLTPIKAN